MSGSADSRIPLTLLARPGRLAAALAAQPRAALLAEAAAPAGPDAQRFTPGAGHVAGCACCQGRNAAATALDLLFQARARGTRPWFDHVIALAPSAAARAEITAALAADSLTRARFRRCGPLPPPPQGS